MDESNNLSTPKSSLRKKIVWALVVGAILYAVLFILVRVWHYDDRQIYVSERLAASVNLNLLIGDYEFTEVLSAKPYCSLQLLNHRKKTDRPVTCKVVSVSVPKYKCPFWWLFADCFGLSTTPELLSDSAIRKKIVDSVSKTCDMVKPENHRKYRYCDLNGNLISKIHILSFETETGKLSLEYTIK